MLYTRINTVVSGLFKQSLTFLVVHACDVTDACKVSVAGSTGFSGSTGFTGATGDTGFTGATGFTGKALPQQFVCAVIMDSSDLIVSNMEHLCPVHFMLSVCMQRDNGFVFLQDSLAAPEQQASLEPLASLESLA